MPFASHRGFSRLGVLLVALGLLVTPLLATPAGASHAWDDGWGPYHWSRAANPAALVVLGSMTAAYDAALTTAVETDWERSVVLDLRIQPDDASRAMRKRCWLAWYAIRACNADYGDSGWGGLADIEIDAYGHIVAAAAAVNDYYLVGMTSTARTQWRQFILCQELGHAFGLDHQDEDQTNANLGTCMDYTNLPASNQHPNAHDFGMLKQLYLPAATTAARAPGAWRSRRRTGTAASRRAPNCRRCAARPTAATRSSSGRCRTGTRGSPS